MKARWDGNWWHCLCGKKLEEAPLGRGTVVLCQCGRLWRYDHWCLNRWRGDTGSTPLEPRWTAGEPKED